MATGRSWHFEMHKLHGRGVAHELRHWVLVGESLEKKMQTVLGPLV